jgi:hypothetical protein
MAHRPGHGLRTRSVRTLFVLALAASGTLAACNHDRIGGLDPDARATRSVKASLTSGEIAAEIARIFESLPQAQKALQKWDQTQEAYGKLLLCAPTDQVCTDAFTLQLTDKLTQLIETAQDNVVKGAISDISGLEQLLADVAAAVGRDGSAYEVIMPEEGGTGETPQGDVVVTIAPETFGVPVILSITEQPDTATLPGNPGETPPVTRSKVYEITTIPKLEAGKAYKVEMCAPLEARSLPGLKIGKYNDEDGFVIGRDTTSTLSCAPEDHASVSFGDGLVGRTLAAVANGARSLVTVKPAWAAHGGIAGSFSNMSFFAIVEVSTPTSLELGTLASEYIYPETVPVSATLTIGAQPSSNPLKIRAVGLSVNGAAADTQYTDDYGVASWTLTQLGKLSISAGFAEDLPYLASSAGPDTVWYRYNYTVGQKLLPPIQNYPNRTDYTSNIPVKFQLFEKDGVTPVTNASGAIRMYWAGAATTSTINPETLWATAPAAPGWSVPTNAFTYANGQYSHGLDVRGRTRGNYTLVVRLNDGSFMYASIGLK